MCASGVVFRLKFVPKNARLMRNISSKFMRLARPQTRPKCRLPPASKRLPNPLLPSPRYQQVGALLVQLKSAVVQRIGARRRRKTDIGTGFE